VFVKLNIQIKPLVRLSELGVAPRVLAHGVDDNEFWVIQTYVDGEAPSRAWLQAHPDEVIARIQTWHRDSPLGTLVGANQPPPYREYVWEEVDRLRRRWMVSDEPVWQTAPLMQTLARFERMPDHFAPTTLVPVHDEPNTSNMLVGPNGLVVIDWDDIRLGDPFRDVGPLFWWYLQERTWGSLLNSLELPGGSGGSRKFTGSRRELHWRSPSGCLSRGKRMITVSWQTLWLPVLENPIPAAKQRIRLDNLLRI
jgi:aminoglycoside phosphotransferase (APT) family kinase protein